MFNFTIDAKIKKNYIDAIKELGYGEKKEVQAVNLQLPAVSPFAIKNGDLFVTIPEPIDGYSEKLEQNTDLSGGINVSFDYFFLVFIF